MILQYFCLQRLTYFRCDRDLKYLKQFEIMKSTPYMLTLAVKVSEIERKMD